MIENFILLKQVREISSDVLIFFNKCNDPRIMASKTFLDSKKTPAKEALKDYHNRVISEYIRMHETSL